MELYLHFYRHYSFSFKHTLATMCMVNSDPVQQITNNYV